MTTTRDEVQMIAGAVSKLLLAISASSQEARTIAADYFEDVGAHAKTLPKEARFYSAICDLLEEFV